MRALSRALAELARDDRYAWESHPADLAEALIEVTACLPVYRTYIQSIEIPGDGSKGNGDAISMPVPGGLHFLRNISILCQTCCCL